MLKSKRLLIKYSIFFKFEELNSDKTGVNFNTFPFFVTDEISLIARGQGYKHCGPQHHKLKDRQRSAILRDTRGGRGQV